MESKDFPRYINFTDAERSESFVLCALQALRTTNSVSKRCGFDIATRPELCLREMNDLIPKIGDLLRLSKMADSNDAGYIDAFANELVALALALRSGTLKSLNLPRADSNKVSGGAGRWHLVNLDNEKCIYTGTLDDLLSYVREAMFIQDHERRIIHLREVRSERECSDLFFMSDVVEFMQETSGTKALPIGVPEAISDEGLCASLQTSVRAVIGQFLPFKSYQYGRTCILSNLSEVDGKYVDKSNGMVLGEIAQ